MYALELFGMLLFLSFNVCSFFFAFLSVHSLIEERRQDAARAVSQPEPATSNVRQPAQVPSSPLAAELAND